MLDINLYIYPLLGIIGILSFTAVCLMYLRPHADQAFLRTGFGGEKVIFQKGKLVVPGLHQLTEVDLRTHAITMLLEKGHGILTKDYAKIDMSAKFLIRVTPETHAIATAARGLGEQTTHTEVLQRIFEDTLASVIRNTLVHYTYKELSEIGTEIEHDIYRASDQILFKNGLEIISVSLIKLGQTKKQYLNAADAIDAKVLRLQEQHSADSQLVRQKDKLLAEKHRLQVDKQELLLKLQHSREACQKEAEAKREIAEINAANDLAILSMRYDAEQVYEKVKVSAG